MVLLDQVGSLLKVGAETITFQRHHRYRENRLLVAPGDADPHPADVEGQPSSRTHVVSDSDEPACEGLQGGVDLAGVLPAALRDVVLPSASAAEDGGRGAHERTRPGPGAASNEEIGRASCRERV